MQVNRLIHWRQGLFLQPQHFQSMQTHTESVANAYSLARSGKESGLVAIDIDEGSLVSGQLSIVKLTCIMPDGAIVSFPGNTDLKPVALSVDQADENGRIGVYVALPSLEIGGDNISTEDGLKRRRFTESLSKDVADTYDPDVSIDVETLSYDAQLIVGAESQAGKNLLSLKIAEIEAEDGVMKLSSRFIPNAFYLASAKSLMQQLRTLKQSLIARHEQLQNVSALTGDASAEVSAAGLRNVIAQQIIADATSRVGHFLDRSETEIQEVYLCLRTVVSALSSFSDKVSVDGQCQDADVSIIPFSTTTLTEGFSRLLGLIELMLNDLTVDPNRIVTLEGIGDGKFTGDIQMDFNDPRTKIYLRLQSAENLDAQAEQIASFSKFGAELQVDVYANRALPGVALAYLEGKPAGVSRQPGSIYFSIDRECFEWAKLVESGRAGLIWAASPDDLKVAIVSVKG